MCILSWLNSELHLASEPFFFFTASFGHTVVHSVLSTGSSCWEMTDRWFRNPERRRDIDRPWLYPGELLDQATFSLYLLKCFRSAPVPLFFFLTVINFSIADWGTNKGRQWRLESNNMFSSVPLTLHAKFQNEHKTFHANKYHFDITYSQNLHLSKNLKTAKQWRWLRW